MLPHVVLVGGGHTHVQVLRRHAMRPFAARMTLVVDDPIAVYSGMVPGFIAGQYRREELEIDVHALARRAGVAVIQERAQRLDEKQVVFADRPPMRFDLASLNIGSTVAGADLPGVREHALLTRPIATLVHRVQARLDGLGRTPRIVVVGAGAGGVELAFCLDQRLRDLGRVPRTSLVFASSRVLPALHERISGRIETAARRRGITLHSDCRATAVTEDALHCGDRSFTADLVVWVVGAAGLPLGAESGLPVDAKGFVQVDDDLRVREDLFAVGDCAVLASWPEIPKAGVYAVREGPVLIDNLEALLAGKNTRPYRPQRDYFALYNLGDGTAVGAKYGVPVEGRAAMLWKDRIDRVFMQKFQVLSPTFSMKMPEMDERMVCGGCAAKVGQTELSAALSRLAPPLRHNVVLGTAEADDAVAWELDGVTWVQNLDAFPAFVDDPYTVGRVAAHNANSDLYAKGVQPRFAMAIVTIPEDRDAGETLFQVMAGIRHVLDAEGIALLGGHSLVGEKLVVGLSVTGSATQPLWTIDRAQVGDAVCLTRPLGTGVLLHADMAGRASGPMVAGALRSMGRGNREALQLQANAVTDVTGFGLAGHAAEVANASGVTIQLDLDALPALEGALALLAAGERSTFHDQNREMAKAFAIHRQGPRTELCFDPQTAGGLLYTTPHPTIEPIGTVLERGVTPLVLR